MLMVLKYKLSYNVCGSTEAVVRALNSSLRDASSESWAVVLNLGLSLSAQHCSSSLSCMKDYMAVDSGGYVCTNSLPTLTAVWLDASQRRQSSFQLNVSARSKV